jgi:hypothetical protein
MQPPILFWRMAIRKKKTPVTVSLNARLFTFCSERINAIMIRYLSVPVPANLDALSRHPL